ncbi:MAG: translation initiation factor eIF-2B [Haloarculaceae archaeon]
MIDETVEEITEMQTHSSSEVAVKAALALLELTGREYPTVEEYHRALEHNSNALRRANRSHASLQTTQREVVDRVQRGADDSVAGAQDRTEEVVDEVVSRVREAKDAAARRAADLVDDGSTVMTHDYSSTVYRTFETAVEQGKSLTVYCTEARPRFLGRKMARRLADLDGVEPVLIVDGASGTFLPECDQVLVGMDCLHDDALYNRVGTYPISATANDVGVPVRSVGGTSKIVDGGFSFENDIRSVSEVIRESPEGFAVENPVYDATPTRLLDAVITNQGVHEF